MKKSVSCILYSFSVAVFLTSCAKNDWQLVWSDEFEGEALNTAYWNVEDNARGGGNAVSFPLQIGDYTATIDMPANAVETILVKL